MDFMSADVWHTQRRTHKIDQMKLRLDMVGNVHTEIDAIAAAAAAARKPQNRISHSFG